MSLFENHHYRWRETYFVLFPKSSRPDPGEVEKLLRSLGDRYEVLGSRFGEDGYYESLSVISPLDFAAMDVTYLDGDDVRTQVEELISELQHGALTSEERAKLARLQGCDARFEIYHFERVMNEEEEEEEDEFLDPGSLLIVIERLAELCNGVGVDPQSGALM